MFVFVENIYFVNHLLICGLVKTKPHVQVIYTILKAITQLLFLWVQDCSFVNLGEMNIYASYINLVFLLFYN